MIDASCDLDLKEDDGNTVLHYAAAYEGSSELINLLVKKGAGACPKNRSGETAREVVEDSL